MTIVVKKEFAFTFPTVILERKVPDTEELNRKLGGRILLQERAETSLKRSNVGGFHSSTDFWKSGGAEPAELFHHVAAAVTDYLAIERRVDASSLQVTLSAEGWSNVARRGHYSKPHVHPNANLSGVYYVDPGVAAVDVPNAEQSGVIEFIDPRHRPHMFETPGTQPFDGYRVVPEASLLLLFPAWLYHYVHPYWGTAPRICVAFNVTIQRLTTRTPTKK